MTNTTYNGLQTFEDPEVDYLFGEDRVKTFPDWPAVLDEGEKVCCGWMDSIPTDLSELKEIIPNVDEL